jgi:hypothetical protein
MSSTPVPVEGDAPTLSNAEQSDADQFLLEERVSSIESMYKTDDWVAPASFSNMTTPEINTIMLTSMMSMLESGAISTTASDIETFNHMAESIHGQVCPNDTVFNTFSTMSASDANAETPP